MIAFIIVVIIGILFYDVETQKDANNAMTSILPFFVFIMYLLCIHYENSWGKKYGKRQNTYN